MDSLSIHLLSMDSKRNEFCNIWMHTWSWGKSTASGKYLGKADDDFLMRLTNDPS